MKTPANQSCPPNDPLCLFGLTLLRFRLVFASLGFLLLRLLSFGECSRARSLSVGHFPKLLRLGVLLANGLGLARLNEV